MRPRCPLAVATLLIGLAGCISVPDDLRAEFEPPDGRRPNNYGVYRETPEGQVVAPDVPTVPAAYVRATDLDPPPLPPVDAPAEDQP